MAASLWEETDSELELPATWQEAIRTDGVVLYRNAATGEFQRAHPISGRVKTVSTDLPPDWYLSIDGSGRITFINSVTGRISYADPRLATTSTSGPISLSKGFTKSRFDRFSVVDEDPSECETSVHRATELLLLRSANQPLRKQVVGYSVEVEVHGVAIRVLLSKNLRGSYILITGSSCGLGHLIATKLAVQGAIVFCACSTCPPNVRPLLECADLFHPTSRYAKSGLFWLPCNLADLNSVVQCGKLFVSLNIPLHICIMASDCFPPGATYFCLGTILSNLSTIRERLMSLLRSSAFSPCSTSSNYTNFSSGPWPTGANVASNLEVKNYLAQVLLLRCLSRPLAQACEECKDPNGRPRIVFLSGDSHRYATLSDAQDAWLSRSLFYSTPSGFLGALSQYATSKLCQLSFLFELQQRIRKWHQESVDTGFSPLLCACNAENLLAVRCSGLWYRSLMEIPCNFILLLLRLARWILGPFLQSVTQAAAAPCFCVTDTSLIHWNTQTHGGSSRDRLLYLDAFRYQPPSSHITNRVNSRTLWEHTNSILDEYDDNTDGWKPLIGPDRT
ncbi:unnamed protein product [Dicrocoelium dendriticum]|nr:unnamed protein product [Dicrocoelium dendriticum]